MQLKSAISKFNTPHPRERIPSSAPSLQAAVAPHVLYLPNNCLSLQVAKLLALQLLSLWTRSSSRYLRTRQVLVQGTIAWLCRKAVHWWRNLDVVSSQYYTNQKIQASILTKEERHIVELKQGFRCSSVLAYSEDQTSNGRSPATQPSRNDSPIDTMRVPIHCIVCSIQIAKLDLLSSKNEEVAAHHSYHWCEEHCERTQDSNEGRCFVYELPWLYDPACDESYESTLIDISIRSLDDKIGSNLPFEYRCIAGKDLLDQYLPLLHCPTDDQQWHLR